MERGSFRQLKLLQTASQWQQACQTRSSQSLILSADDPGADAHLNRYRDYLGHEFESVLIDCQAGLNADAICALCGTIVGGGELILLLPSDDSAMVERLQRFATQYFSNNALPANASDSFKKAQTEHQVLTEALTGEFISGTSLYTHILIAERGRGKSTLLGKALAEVSATCAETEIIVTAPRKANAQVLLKQAPTATFKAWDKLLEQPGDSTKQLIIDEAAGIPLWATEKLCQKFTPWLLATTVSGYEGCGRGFAIHFQQWAEKHLPKVKNHRLSVPMRWPENDPLEHWLTDTFLMDETATALTRELADGQFIEHALQLQENTLRQCFQLLLNAHYQSSPNDLNLLLSDPLHRLAYTRQNGEVVAVAWLIKEGPVPKELHTPILQGKRRPKGNLLPQAIGYFLQQPWALSASWLRVARIAVPAGLRHQGYASELLGFIQQHPSYKHINKTGTSFAWEPGVAKFWEANGFVPWRTSHRLDSVSARPAAIYVRADSMGDDPSSNTSLTDDISRWAKAEQNWLINAHSEIPENLITNPLPHLLVKAYVNERIPFDAAHFALAVYYQNKHPADELTQYLSRPSCSLKQLAQLYGCASKQQANVKLRKDTAPLV